MSPRIKSGDLVTVEPSRDGLLKKNDIVLCLVSGRQYLHIIKSIRTMRSAMRYQIGNNRGGINGWVKSDRIYGKVTAIGG